MQRSIIILGGYGNFGSRIATALANEPNVCVLIAGRDESKAALFAEKIRGNTKPLLLDHQAANLSATLQTLNAHVLVHTAGPFQKQDYSVAQACIKAGCHYLDIADGRDYVSGISQLEAAARKRNVLVVAGASSLPALSSAVVEKYLNQFARLENIEHAISSGAKPPGIATMQGVMSYVGKPFKRWQQSAWQIAYGWQDAVTYHFPEGVGKRCLVSCDVPDLELFPKRYSQVQSVIFRAGIGFISTTLTVWALSWLVRAGFIENLAKYARMLHRVAVFIEPFGTQWSAMRVQLAGIDHQQLPLRKTWTLLAGNNDGPSIPCSPAIALARKLIRNEVSLRGAMPCMGLLTVDEILRAIPNLNFRIVEE